MSTKKNSILLIVINFFFVLVAVLILFNFIPKNLFQKKADTFSPTLERMEIAIPAKGFIAKQEIIYKAPVSGKVKRIKQAPELLAKNDEAVQILDLNSKVIQSIKIQDEGFITYIKDGCEEILALDTLSKKSFSEDEIINPPANQVKVSDDQVVEKDDFIFKIVKANIVQFFLVIDTKEVEKFNIGDNLVFTILDPQNVTVDGKIFDKKIVNEKKTLLIFETSFLIEPLINLRKISGSFTFPYVTACLIPSKAVEIKKDAKGIDRYYVLVKQNIDNKITAIQTEIKVIGQNSHTKYYIVDQLKEDLTIFKEFTVAQKRYTTSGK